MDPGERPQVDPVAGAVAEIGNGGNAIARLVDEDIRADATDQRVVAAAAVEHIVAVETFKRVVAAIAGDDVIELGAPHRVDAAVEVIVPDRVVAIGIAGPAGTERDDDAAGRMIVGDAGVAVADDGIVAGVALEFIEGRAAAIDA